MFQYVVEWAMTKAGQRTEGSSPTRYELTAIHFLYLLPLFHLLQASLRYFASFLPLPYINPLFPHIDIGDFLLVSGVLVSLTVIFMIWTVQFRKSQIDTWVISHLLWLFKAYASLALFCMVSFLVFVILILLVFVVKPLAFLMIYGIPLFVLCAVILFFSRITRGYAAFLKKKPMKFYTGRKQQYSDRLGGE